MHHPFVDKLELYIINHLDSASTMLIFMGIIGTITSSIAQQIRIKSNPKLPKDTKTFLINQERNDCMLNAGLTWLTGTSSKQIVKYLTNKGYLLNDSVRQGSDAVGALYQLSHKQLSKSGFFKAAKEGAQELNIIQFPGLKRRFDRCQEGLSIIATIGAAILTTNLLVPILRNKLSKPAPKSDSVPKLSVQLAQNMTSNKFSVTYPSVFSNSMKI